MELGLFEDGRPVAVSLLRRNALIGGMTDSGKSGILNVILAFLAACADVIIWGIDLKGGMELQPWANCLGEIATTPDEAVALLRDTTTELDRRAASLTRRGQRLLQPSAAEPALITVIDEYAEMPPDALAYADSVARRGRAIAVNLIAATQRPTQEAMGNNAVRSQMDVRICLRVRERRDVDLILGQGAFRAGWHAQALTQPGSFLISAREHTTPDRARGYLITDDQVTRHAARHAGARPGPAAAPGRPAGPPGSPQPPAPGPTGVPGRETAPGSAEAALGALWAALSEAPEQGYPVWVLMGACGKSRSWVYARLTELAAAGRAEQARYGSWRAAGPPGDHAG